MRKVLMSWILSIAAIGSYAQTITVRSQQANDVDFTEYKTFYWAQQVVDKEAGLANFVNDLALKAMIMDAVKGELTGLGYQENEADADLLVNFRVFEKPVIIKNRDDYGTDYWGTSSYSDMNNGSSYEVEAGTLLVSLVDRENGRIVWNGFASGLIDNNAFIKDPGKVSEAVNMIFDEYNQRAKTYSRK